MRKILLAVMFALAIPAHAHGQGYGSPWVPFGVGVIIGNMLTRPQPVYVYPSQTPYGPVPTTVYVYPPSAPVIPSPWQRCELRSEMIDGQVVTGNYCYSR